ncbi:hypothetical protein AGMMS50276_09520 [Synergistales bacterium]|nr:hypothetical protein AGMMS50276_09520 [Synergistales bacterium]
MSKFTYDERKGGVICEKYKIAPWPNFNHRRIALLDLVKQNREKFGENPEYLEIGCGNGVLAYELSLLGFKPTVTDWNEKALDIVSELFDHKIKRSLDDSDRGKYDVVGAYEVLEHNENDFATLSEWASYIKQGGHMLLSVPAHMKQWSDLDERAGHYRRYEKASLRELFEKSGFENIQIITAGFPFMVFFYRLKEGFYSLAASKKARKQESKKARKQERKNS